MPTFNVHMLAFADPYIVRKVDVPQSEIDRAPYDSEHPEHHTNYILDRIYHYGQNDFQPRPCPSVSVGDVIEFQGRSFIVAQFGFKELATEELIQFVLTPRRNRHISKLIWGDDDSA